MTGENCSESQICGVSIVLKSLKKNTYIYENIKPCFLISQKQPSKKPLTSALVQKTEEGHVWKVSFWGLLSFFDLINGSEHNLDVSLGAWS